VATDHDQHYGLRGGERLADGLRRVAIGRAGKASERLRGIGAGEADPAEAVHGARKDMKKLRTVLRLIRPRLPKRAYREQNRRFRDASRSLSTTRDAEVKLETLEQLAQDVDGLPGEALASWRLILESEREAATNAARDEPVIAAAAAEIEAGLAEIAAWPLAGDSWQLVGNGLERAYRRGRRAMLAAGGGEDSFHEWRKRAKDLWYALRLLGAAWPPVLGPGAEEAHRLSELLGDHHDLAVLREDLHGRRLGEVESRVLEAAIDAREAELAAAAFDLGERLYAERPKAFSRRLRAYWKAWRG
jgi:CHAD domain-containing protein